MFNPNSQQPSQQKSLCPSHHLGFSDICFHENCTTRYLCRACKLDHTENHLRNIFSLAEVQNGDFLASIDDIITAKKETLLNKVKDKHVMLKKVNNAFFEIQNEIEKVLIETKTEIIHSIERLYQDLKGGYSEEYFQEIHEFLKKFSEDFKKQEVTQLSSSFEQFSQIYFKTINSINSGIQIAAKFEDSSLDLQGILDSVKSSCQGLLAKTTPETPKTVANKNKTHITRASPQEIVCMEHLSNLGYFVTGGNYGLLTIWEDLNFSCVSQLQVHDGSIDNIVYLPNDLTLVTTSIDNHIAIIKLNLEGNAESIVRNKTLKPIRHIVSIRDYSKVAMISDQGHRMRIGDALKDLRDSHVLEIPKIADTSKLLLIREDKLIGVTYLNNIALLSLETSTLQDNLQIEGVILSACYVPESKTIHALLQAGQDSRDDRYEEVIFRRNEQGRYSKFSQTQIERIKVFGKPLEIVAGNSTILTVFSRAYSLRKAQNTNGEPKFYEIQSQTCSNENMGPAFISEVSGKFILTKDIRKIEINSLP